MGASSNFHCFHLVRFILITSLLGWPPFVNSQRVSTDERKQELEAFGFSPQESFMRTVDVLNNDEKMATSPKMMTNGNDPATEVSPSTMRDETLKGEGMGISPIYCPYKEYPERQYGLFVLPKTVATADGAKVLSPCPYGVSDVGAVRIFQIMPDMVESPMGAQRSEKEELEPGLVAHCALYENSTKGVWQLGERVDLHKCREQAWEALGNSVRTLTTQTITPYNMRQATPLLMNLLRVAVKDYQSAEILIDSISTLLEADDIFNDPGLQGTRKTLFSLIDSYTQLALLQPGEGVSVSSSSKTVLVETLVFPPVDEAVYTYDFESMHLPAEALNMSREASSDHTPRLQLVAYSNQLFFHWGQNRSWTEEHNHNSSQMTEIVENENAHFEGKWRVLSMKVQGVNIQNLTQPIVYTLPVNQTLNHSQWLCVYWDERESKWSREGMRTLRLPNGGLQCESDHLTAFSALLDPLPFFDDSPDPSGDDGDSGDGNGNVKPKGPTPQLQPDIHAHILSILSSVGSALSLTGLAITVLTFALFRCLRRERSNRILLNLSVSLFFLHLLSLVGDGKLWNYHCLIPATLLHYLLLSSISWMTVEALHMHNLLISVFVQPQSRFLTKRALFAWGVPFLIVLICACVDPKVYKNGRGEWCIMAGHLNLAMYYVGYLGPAGLLLIVNIFVFVRILQVLNQQGAKLTKRSKMVPPEIKLNDGGAGKDGKGRGDGQGKGQHQVDWKPPKKPTSTFFFVSPTQVKGALTVMVLLGVGWILGFFAIGPFKLVFQYLFCLCNAGQGVLIFLFRVLLHPQANRTWRKAVTRGFHFDSDLNSSSYASTTRKSNNSIASISTTSSVSSTPTTKSPPSSSIPIVFYDHSDAPPNKPVDGIFT